MPSIIPFLNKINKFFLNPLIVLMFTVATLIFFIGIFQMILNTESEEGRDKGRKNIMYGLIGMFIMISVYGIVRLVMATFGIDPTGYIF